MKGKRAVEWKLVDATVPASRFKEEVHKRAEALAATSDRPATGPGVQLSPLGAKVSADAIEYSSLSLTIDRPARVATLTVRAPEAPVESTLRGDSRRRRPVLAAARRSASSMTRCCGCATNEPEIGTVVLKAEGDPALVLQADDVLFEQQSDWFVREVHALHQAHVEAARSVGAQLLRADRAGQRVCGHAVRDCRLPPIARTC